MPDLDTAQPALRQPCKVCGQPCARCPAAQVPLKRVNQVYVIATSTKVDVSEVEAGHLEDGYFKAAEKPRGEKKGEEAFFKAEAEDKPKVRFWLARAAAYLPLPGRAQLVQKRRFSRARPGLECAVGGRLQGHV